jgi:hypothetical protein
MTVGELRDFVLDRKYGVPWMARQSAIIGPAEVEPKQEPIMLGSEDLGLRDFR